MNIATSQSASTAPVNPFQQGMQSQQGQRPLTREQQIQQLLAKIAQDAQRTTSAGGGSCGGGGCGGGGAAPISSGGCAGASAKTEDEKLLEKLKMQQFMAEKVKSSVSGLGASVPGSPPAPGMGAPMPAARMSQGAMA